MPQCTVPLTPSRRLVLLGAASALLSSDVGAQRQFAAMARGFVRDSRSGGRGLPGVMVSNGCDVVLTSSDGSWNLPVSAGDFVFVVKPSGWSFSQCADRPSSWFHMHEPRGTPARFASRFPGVAPTGALPDSIDFFLEPEPQSDRFDVALVADTQPGNAEELGFVRDSLLARMSGSGAAFAIHHGDVMGDDLSLLSRYKSLLVPSGIRWHHCPGNHDMNRDAGDPNLAFETWRREFGPLHYAFQHAGATFILLNNVAPLQAGRGRAGERGYAGQIGRAQLAFVENVLRHVPREHLVVVSMHIPLVCYEDATHPSDNTGDAHRLLAILSRRPNTVSFAGHSHTTEHHYLGSECGFAREEAHHHHVLTAACGSWWSGPRDARGVPYSVSRDGTPRGYHRLSIEGNRYSTRFVPTDDDQDRSMRVMVECAGRGLTSSPLSPTELLASRLLVNVFDGCPRTRVRVEIDAPYPRSIELQRIDAVDPHVSEFLSTHAAICKPWATAAATSHLWAVPLPTGLPAGAHRARVSVRHANGLEQSAETLLEVSG